VQFFSQQMGRQLIRYILTIIILIFSALYIGIAIGIPVTLILLVSVGIFLFWKRRHARGTTLCSVFGMYFELVAGN
jgi:hypothetical protein